MVQDRRNLERMYEQRERDYQRSEMRQAEARARYAEYERELFAHDRFLGQVDIGGLPYAKVAKSIELLATQVLPAMRRPAPR